MNESKGQIVKLYSTLRSGWDNISERKKTYYLYTILFFLVFLVAFSPFLTAKTSFICVFDGRETIVQEHIFYGKWIRQILNNFLHGDFSIPLYDFSKGWGSRIIDSGIDPLLLLIAPFFNLTYTEFLYSILIILRLYLAGLSFLYLCSYFRKDWLVSLAGCFVYLFSAYMFYGGLAFPGYITPMIQLPLLIVGAERVMRKERSIGFVFSVMYVALCGYYHLYIQTILIGLYCIVRLFALYPKGQRLKALPGRLGSGIGKWLLGIGLAAFVLLPSMLGFGSAGRSSFSNVSISSSLALHWRYFWVRLMTLISPIREYDWDWGMDYPAYAAIFLLCAAVIVSAGRKKKFTQKWLLGIGLFMLFCPWCGLVMNGLQYPCNRWSFGLSLLAGFLVADTIPDLFRMSRAQKRASVITVAAYGCIALLSSTIRSTVFASVGTAFLAATLLLIVLCKNGSERLRRIRTVLCLGLVCLNVCANALFLISVESMGWIRWFCPMESETDRLIVAVEGEPAYSPFGYEVSDGRIDSTYLSYVTSTVYSQPATTIYNPLLNGNIVEFRDATESCGNVQYFKIYTSDQRTMLSSLLSVDQQFEREGSEQFVPYGYNYLGDTYLFKVYQNEYSLGWGYSYDQSLSYDEVAGRNGVEMQEIMMRSVILDADQQLKHGAVETENDLIPCVSQCYGCTWEDGTVTVDEGGGVIALFADLPKGKEYYVRVKGFNIDGYGDEYFTTSTSASFNLSVECGNVSKYARVMDSSYPWYYGRENYLFCLGCVDEDRDVVQVQIPAAGSFKLEDIELYALPLEHYPELAEKLREEPLENVVLGENTLSGTIDVTGTKVLCVTVPYENGWTAYVDGQDAEILRANYAFMGLKLTEGHHEITFKYHVPYLTAGIVVSVVCLGLTIGLYLFLKRKRGEKKEEIAS